MIFSTHSNKFKFSQILSKIKPWENLVVLTSTTTTGFILFYHRIYFDKNLIYPEVQAVRILVK